MVHNCTDCTVRTVHQIAEEPACKTLPKIIGIVYGQNKADSQNSFKDSVNIDNLYTSLSICFCVCFFCAIVIEEKMPTRKLDFKKFKPSCRNFQSLEFCKIIAKFLGQNCEIFRPDSVHITKQ